MTKPPFEEGDTVRIKDNYHLGLHRVDTCEWVDWTKPGVPHYWGVVLFFAVILTVSFLAGRFSR